MTPEQIVEVISVFGTWAAGLGLAALILGFVSMTISSIAATFVQ